MPGKMMIPCAMIAMSGLIIEWGRRGLEVSCPVLSKPAKPVCVSMLSILIKLSFARSHLLSWHAHTDVGQRLLSPGFLNSGHKTVR